jgi:prephenate dehydrogenase
VFKHVAIIAPGLLGASLGMALKDRCLAGRVTVWARRAEARAACAGASWCDAAPATLAAAVADAGLVVVCTPVDVILPCLREMGPALAAGALVTDVGSTKGSICRTAPGVLPAGRVFVGSHPMAGSERTGMAHADAGLFAGRACLVTPLDATPAAAVAAVCGLWTALGMRVAKLSPEAHDAAVAHISHLPHVLAALLCAQLAGRDPAWADYAGQGLRDTTRVAGGSPDLWLAILAENRAEVAQALGAFGGHCVAAAAALRAGDDAAVRQVLQEGWQYRQRLDRGR